MTNPSVPCRTYIVYHHGLFAQGVRSVLEHDHSVQIVGMESNVAKALQAVRSLRPEVILVEEPTEHWGKWPFLELAAAGRIVTMSLDHEYATVYDEHRITAADPADLVKAIQGARAWEKPQNPVSDPPGGEATVAGQPESGSIAPKTQAAEAPNQGLSGSGDGREQKRRPEGRSKSPRSARRPS